METLLKRLAASHHFPSPSSCQHPFRIYFSAVVANIPGGFVCVFVSVLEFSPLTLCVLLTCVVLLGPHSPVRPL